MSETVLGAVLVGGESRRMGSDKALVDWRGTTLLERAVGSLRKVVDEVVVVGDRGSDYELAGCSSVPDIRDGLGPLGGLQTALEEGDGRPVFVLACDLPRVSPELIRFILEAAAGGSQAVAPSLAGRIQPLCSWYPASIRPLLDEFLAAGGRRAVDFLGEIEARELSIGPHLSFYAADLLLNVNRPEQLESARGGEA